MRKRKGEGEWLRFESIGWRDDYLGCIYPFRFLGCVRLKSKERSGRKEKIKKKRERGGLISSDSAYTHV